MSTGRWNWAFEYQLKELEKAAEKKAARHEARLKWWQAEQQKVMEEIKSKGWEVKEGLAAVEKFASRFNPDALPDEYGGNCAMSNVVGGHASQMVVKDDYQAQLNETHKKIKEHYEKMIEYRNWQQLMADSLEKGPRQLNIEDYKFFFGND